MEQEEGRQTILGAISNYIYAPTKFFERNEEKSRIVLPMLLILLASIILELVVLPISMNSEEVMAQVGQQVNTESFGKIVMITGTIGAVIGSVISMLLISLIILLCVKYLLKGEGKYKTILSVYVYSLLPQMVLNLICAIVYKTTNHITSNLLTTIVMSINPLTIWSLVLLIIGIHVVSKVSIKECSILFIALEAVSLVISVGGYFIKL